MTIVLKGEEKIIENLRPLFEMVPGLEFVEEEAMTEIDVQNDVDLRFSHAISELRKDGVFRYPYDYTWIMEAAGQDVIPRLKGFHSPQSFIDYLKNLGFDKIPSRSTLNKGQNSYTGKFPDWIFIDTDDPGEILRRKNVVKRFVSAFVKAPISNS